MHQENLEGIFSVYFVWIQLFYRPASNKFMNVINLKIWTNYRHHYACSTDEAFLYDFLENLQYFLGTAIGPMNGGLWTNVEFCFDYFNKIILKSFAVICFPSTRLCYYKPLFTMISCLPEYYYGIPYAIWYFILWDEFIFAVHEELYI